MKPRQALRVGDYLAHIAQSLQGGSVM